MSQSALPVQQERARVKSRSPAADLTALREGEIRYRELVDHLQSGVVVYEATAGGEDFIIRDFNPAAARLEKTTPRAVIGRLVTEAFPGVADFGLLAVLRRVWRTGRAEHHPISLYRDQHLSSWRENYVYRLPSGLLVAVYDDVTERKLAEETLSKYRLLAAQARDIMLFLRAADGAIVEANAAAEAAYGYSREELLCLHIDALRPAGEGRTIDRRIKAAGKAGVLFETEHRRKDGSVFPVEVSVRGAAPVGGEGVILSVVRDVSERKRAEEALVQGALQAKLALKAAVAALGATAEMRDPYTAGHQRRVAQLAGAIAAELGWADRQSETLRTAALLHDIGKIVVPAEILSKPALLTEIEMQLVRQHAAAGADTVANIDFGGTVAEVIRQHHERLDGSGYPAGLKGGDILPEARILAIADVVEAMISHRPYRPALPVEEALAEIESGSGPRYDSEAAAACVRLFREKGFTLSA